jgi:hypothetical protein
VPCVDMNIGSGRYGRLLRHGLALACSGFLMVGCDTLHEMAHREPAPAPSPADKGRSSSSQGAAAARGGVALGPPATPRSLADLRQKAARRLVEANPNITYTSRPPDILLAIPVLTVELHADGSVKRIDVLRYPGQARDTVEIAMQAVRRAAPYGDVSHLPKPWKFNETFLFNDQRRFKPMTLDR